MQPIHKYLFQKKPLAFLAATLLLSSSVHAEALSGSHSHGEIHDLDPYVVDAALSPRSTRDMLTPATVVAADELELNRAPTIGEVLDGQAGVHTSSFGGGASRPVIRGLGGNRLRVLESGVDSGDLSADSPDHAVSAEPFFIEQIEVLRGASTLLYGSSAIGGAVNIIDKRIPRELPGEHGTFEAMADYQSAADGWTLAGLAAVPVEDFVFSLSYLNRDHNDYSIPGHADLDEEHEDEPPSVVLENSFVETESGSVALSWFPTGTTRVSLAWNQTDSLYGVPGHAHEDHEGEEDHDEPDHEEEEGVSIDLAQSTTDLEFEHRLTDSWIQTIEGRVRYVTYEHQELEGEELGTDFDRESLEARLVATYLAGDIGPGALGGNWSSLDSSAIGEESLTPESKTDDAALFLLQEWQLDSVRIEGGIRAEHRDIELQDDPGYSDWAYSASLGAKVPVGENVSISLLFNHAERHPVATELYAYGPHAATRQFEIGDPSLGLESANGIDAAYHYKTDILSAALTAFYTDFSDYIYTAPTAEEMDGLPVYRYTQVDTRFQGLEAELTWHAWHEGAAYFDVGLLMDCVDTHIKGSADNLPQIPPYRLGFDIQFGSKTWVFASSLLHSFKQDDTAPFEDNSDAFTNWSASLLLDLPIAKGDWHLIVSGDNLLDEEMRPHTSPIKDVAPLPGRSLRLNLSVAF
jgi:iron complex outermembrane receptor protein